METMMKRPRDLQVPADDKRCKARNADGQQCQLKRHSKSYYHAVQEGTWETVSPDHPVRHLLWTDGFQGSFRKL